MKQLCLVSVLGASLLLTACSSGQRVDVVTEKDRSVIQSPAQVTNITPEAMSSTLPNNATAICRDGSYSIAKEHICVGRGGIATKIHRYFAE